MATFKIYKLHFTSPLHISDSHEEANVSMKTIHSDTLQAALMSCLAQTGFNVPDDGNLGFTTSSLFPYYQEKPDSLPVYFLPMPMQARPLNLADVSQAKKVKAVQWVDVESFEKLLDGENLFGNENEDLNSIQGSYLTRATLPPDANGMQEFIRSEVAQRVTIEDRTGSSDAKPYYVDRILFKDYAGFYFLAVGDTELLDKALSLLAQEGIGTNRHVGFGFFEYTTEELTINLPDEADHLLSLSLFIPESQEQLQQMLASDDVAYDFVRRGGWITTYPYTTLRKNAIYGFLPGSVFGRAGTETGGVICLGKIADLTPSIGDATPSHPIWRNGKSIMLPIKLNP